MSPSKKRTNFDDFNNYSENNLSKAIKFALEKEKL